MIAKLVLVKIDNITKHIKNIANPRSQKKK